MTTEADKIEANRTMMLARAIGAGVNTERPEVGLNALMMNVARLFIENNDTKEAAAERAAEFAVSLTVYMDANWHTKTKPRAAGTAAKPKRK